MKRLIPLWLCLAWMPPVHAQKMRDVFATMPDSILRVMTKNNRLDCIDFIENDMTARVRNRFDGFTVLKTLTRDYLDLQLTPSCRVEMKLLPAGDSTNFVCVARTFAGPEAETVLELYAPGWRKLDAGEWLPRPAYADFWAEPDSALSAQELARLQRLQDMRFVTAALQPDGLRLTFALRPGEVDKEERERMEKVLRPVAYEWDGKRFSRVGQQ